MRPTSSFPREPSIHQAFDIQRVLTALYERLGNFVLFYVCPSAPITRKAGRESTEPSGVCDLCALRQRRNRLKVNFCINSRLVNRQCLRQANDPRPSQWRTLLHHSAGDRLDFRCREAAMPALSPINLVLRFVRTGANRELLPLAMAMKVLVSHSSSPASPRNSVTEPAIPYNSAI